jgi:hypothetical protein
MKHFHIGQLELHYLKREKYWPVWTMVADGVCKPVEKSMLSSNVVARTPKNESLPFVYEPSMSSKNKPWQSKVP